MQRQFSPEVVARIRTRLRGLATGSTHNRLALESLILTGESNVRTVEAALAGLPIGAGQLFDPVRKALRLELQRTLDGVGAARRLYAAAREQEASADLLASDLEPLGLREPAPGAGGATASRRVLIVDDYEDLRHLLVHLLTSAGFVVRTAANGLEALIAAHEMQPDVIIMDISMPVLDGIEATRLIKAAESTRNAHVIAFTAAGVEQPHHRDMFSDVLPKPCPPDVVVAAVRKCVAH